MHHRTDRLRAFCSVTIDNDFVVHDLRVIEGRKGLFVAMPSRKLSDNCPRCGSKNDLRAKFCSECGAKLEETRSVRGAGREKYHVDVAHPINTPCREVLQTTVLSAYKEEEKRAQEGLAPLHEYAPEGEPAELAEEYVEVDEVEELGGYREPEYEEPVAVRAGDELPAEPEAAGVEVEVEPPLEAGEAELEVELSPEAEREALEEAPEVEAEALSDAEEPEAEPVQAEEETGSDERKPRRVRREREPGGFNQGIL